MAKEAIGQSVTRRSKTKNLRAKLKMSGETGASTLIS
jgi:hypothetical protein